MPLLALLVAAAIVGFEQFIEAQYGVLGAVGVILLAIGVKAQNVTCSCMGAVVLATLILA